MKKIIKKIQSVFKSDGNSNAADKLVVNDSQDTETLSQEERNRRIDLAAKITVQKYGHIIERLAKE